MRIHGHLSCGINFDLWKMVEENLFLQKQSMNIMCPSEENVVLKPNHKENGDYHENPCLSHLWDKL